MKLVYLINGLGAGGAERHLLNLARDMVMRGYSVSVIALKKKIRGGAKSLEHDFVDAGADIVYLNSFLFGEIGRWISLLLSLGRLRPDIIHSHLPRADLAASVAKAFRPSIFWVSTIHDSYIKGTYSGYWIFPFIKWNWARVDEVIAVSKRVQEWGIQALALPADKTRVIFHGVPLYETQETSEREHGKTLFIGCLARFEERKGIGTLVRAMVEISESFPEAQLLLAGSDPTGYSSVIKKLAASLGIENKIKVLGFCAAPLEFLLGIDVFAFASVSEGFGIVLIEAMSVRRPVVASNIYPINHIVQDGRTGMLVDPTDPHAFAKAIIELLGDPERRREMGDAGYLRCIEDFSLETSLGKVHELYVDMHEKRLRGE